jgi:hypothetical protein
MGKHVPLPSDPIERAAEKKRRFSVYRCQYQRHQRKLEKERKVTAYRQRRELAQAARRLNIDLCLDLNDLTLEQFRKNISTAERWIAEL